MTVVYFTPEAEEQALSAARSWREHARENPELFSEQLLLAQTLAARMKEAYAVYSWVNGVAVRRVQMARAQHHLYCTHDRKSDELWVVAVWGSRRAKSAGRRFGSRSTRMPDYSDPVVRAAEKQKSRERDMQQLTSRRKTVAELPSENRAIRLSGERIKGEHIKFVSSTGDWW